MGRGCLETVSSGIKEGGRLRDICVCGWVRGGGKGRRGYLGAVVPWGAPSVGRGEADGSAGRA